MAKSSIALQIVRMIVMLVFIAGMTCAAWLLARHGFAVNDHKTLLDACVSGCSKLVKAQSHNLENEASIYGLAAFVAAALAVIGCFLLGKEILE